MTSDNICIITGTIIAAVSAATAAVSSLRNGRTLKWIQDERIKAAGLWAALSRPEKKTQNGGSKEIIKNQAEIGRSDWYKPPDL